MSHPQPSPSVCAGRRRAAIVIVAIVLALAARGQLAEKQAAPNGIEPMLLPLLVTRKRRSFPVDERWSVRMGDEVRIVIANERQPEAEPWLTSGGWQLVSAA